jgi:hypothetical protein
MEGEKRVENGQEGVSKTINCKAHTLSGQTMIIDFDSLSRQTMVLYFDSLSWQTIGSGRAIVSQDNCGQWQAICSTMGTLLYSDRSRNHDCAPGTPFRPRGIVIVVRILFMMALCRIIRSFLGYIVCGDIGVFPS